jgi:hypothetical protein
LHEGTCVNPHQLREKRDVPPVIVSDEWGIPKGKSGLKIGQCVDPDMRRRVQHIWPLYYGRALTPGQLISKEFVLGIVVEYKMSVEVDWVGFAVETNSTQHSQYYINMTKWINMRNESQKKSKVRPLPHDVIHLSQSSSDPERPTDSSRSAPRTGSELSPQWNKVLVDEVGELLELTQLEWEASKNLATELTRQKDANVMKCQAQGMMVESVTLELLDNRRELDNLECPFVPVQAVLPADSRTTMEESTPAPSSKAGDHDREYASESEVSFDSHLPVDGIEAEATGPCSSGNLDSDLVYALKVKVKCLESLLQKHKASYSACLAQSKLQAVAISDSVRRRDSQELLFHMLEEQYLRMKESKAPLSMHPHPMCYPDVDAEQAYSYMKLGDCALCCRKFPFNDIVVSHC